MDASAILLSVLLSEELEDRALRVLFHSHIGLSLGALKSAEEIVIMVFLLSVSPLILY